MEQFFHQYQKGEHFINDLYWFALKYLPENPIPVWSKSTSVVLHIVMTVLSQTHRVKLIVNPLLKDNADLNTVHSLIGK